MKNDDEVTVVNLYDGFYLVETPTKFVVYQNLYDESNRKKLWRVYKSQVDSLSEAVKMWLTSLN